MGFSLNRHVQYFHFVLLNLVLDVRLNMTSGSRITFPYISGFVLTKPLYMSFLRCPFHIGAFRDKMLHFFRYVFCNRFYYISTLSSFSKR